MGDHHPIMFSLGVSSSNHWCIIGDQFAAFSNRFTRSLRTDNETNEYVGGFYRIMDAYLYNFCIFTKALTCSTFKTIWYQYVRLIFAITFISQIHIEFGMYYNLLFFHSWNCFLFGFTTFSIILVVQKKVFALYCLIEMNNINTGKTCY